MNITSSDPQETGPGCRQALWYIGQILEHRAKARDFNKGFLLGVQQQIQERGFVSWRQKSALKRIYERYHMGQDRDCIENWSC
jgi:hypothetical protein